VLRFSGLMFVVALMGLPSLASAQQGGADLRLGFGAVLDFAGEADVDTGPGFDPDDDLKLTPGLRVHLDYDVHRYISVGGLVRASWWEGDDYFEERSFLFDLAFRLTGHYDWRDFRFYGALTVGPTISAINDDNTNQLDNPGVGANVSITPGAEWWFSRRAGLYLEMFGWSGHFFNHDYDLSNSGDAEFSLNQVTWQTGIVFAP
jgi:hypothetical protein